jgi:hypothetical protein
MLANILRTQARNALPLLTRVSAGSKALHKVNFRALSITASRGFSHDDSPYGRVARDAGARLPKQHEDVPPSESIFVGNLPYEMDQDELRQVFRSVAEPIFAGQCM